MRYSFDQLTDTTRLLIDLMLLGTLNQGMIFLAIVLDISATFSMQVGYASTQPVKVQTTTRRY
jgi:hypothetical protein